jgi:predicted alpha/beta superfamily hydrolase
MNAQLTPIVVPNSDVRSLTSSSIGQEYRISVSLPMNYADSGEKCPVLYVLDPSLMFDYVTGMTRSATLLGPLFNVQVPNFILIGIGYPNINLRQRDMTPTKDPDEREMEGMSGGAEGFLRFIRDELMPYINSNYRTDPKDSTIVGGSLGGLFALYVLFNRPDTFRRYVALSPTLDWDNKVTFQYEREYASKHTDLPARLFLSTGTNEGGEEEGAVILANFKELVTILDQRKYKGLEWESRIYESEGHVSAIYSGTCKGILSVFSINF